VACPSRYENSEVRDGEIVVLRRVPFGTEVIEAEIKAPEGMYRRLLRLSEAGSGGVVTIPLPPVGRVRGQVRAPDGTPIPGATVRVLGPAGRTGAADSFAPYPTVSGLDGAYELTLHAGAARLWAGAPGYVIPGGACDLQIPAAEGPVGHDIILVPGGALTGRVVGGDGRPVDAEVVVQAEGDPASVARARTDSEGRWIVDGVAGTRFRVRVDAAPARPVIVEGVPPDSVVPDIVLSGR
jgi:hypothetical protein